MAQQHPRTPDRRSTPPLPRRSDRRRSAVIASTMALAFAALLTWLVVSYASRRPDQVRLGTRTFVVGRADRLAKPIARDGPFLFKDPLDRDRELYLQHLGDRPDRGWVAVGAYAPGAPRELRCLLEWRQAEHQFRDPCSATTYPADGTGLDAYPAEVDDGGAVIVDLRTAGRARTG